MATANQVLLTTANNNEAIAGAVGGGLTVDDVTKTLSAPTALSATQKAAIDAANNPSGTNPVATLLDMPAQPWTLSGGQAVTAYPIAISSPGIGVNPADKGDPGAGTTTLDVGAGEPVNTVEPVGNSKAYDGLKNHLQGGIYMLINRSPSYSINLNHNASTTGTPFLCPQNTNFVLAPRRAVLLVHIPSMGVLVLPFSSS
jgi:hypothetical protein